MMNAMRTLIEAFQMTFLMHVETFAKFPKIP